MLSKVNILKQSTYLLMRTSTSFANQGNLKMRRNITSDNLYPINMHRGKTIRLFSASTEPDQTDFDKSHVFDKSQNEQVNQKDEKLTDQEPVVEKVSHDDEIPDFDRKLSEKLRIKMKAAQIFNKETENSKLKSDLIEKNYISDTSQTEFENSDIERSFRREQHYLKQTKYFPKVIDPETGAPILNDLEADALQKYKQRVAEMEPVIQTPFKKDQYIDWMKEVDKETLRTSQKIDHYKRSEQLLKAIQARINSAQTPDDQKELQNYLIEKIGYKHASYPDFIGNQLTQETNEAKQEAKRSAILKAQKDSQEFLNFNDQQIRDSANLNGKHAWNADQYVPASEIDQVTRQKERQLMTQKEYQSSRQQDEEILSRQRLLWDGPVGNLNDQQLKKLYDRKMASELLSDGGTTIRQIVKGFNISKEEEEALNNYHKQPFDLITRMDRLKIAEEESKNAQEQLNQFLEEEKQLDKQYLEALDQIVKVVEEDEKGNSSDMPCPSDFDDRNMTVSEEDYVIQGENQYNQQQGKDKEEQNSLAQMEKILTSHSGLLWPAHAYNKVTEAEYEELKQVIKEQPEKMKKLAEELLELEQLSAEESVEGFYNQDKQDEEREVFKLMEQSDDEKEKALLFFEEEADYLEFAKAFVQENAEGKSQEEAAQLRAKQDEIRRLNMPNLLDSSAEDSDFFFNKPELLEKVPKNQLLSELENKYDLFGNQTTDSQDEGYLDDLDYQRMLQQDRGTFEGKRRFERIDRVSQDAQNDKLDQLKLKVKYERVYDKNGALLAMENPVVIEETIRRHIEINDVFKQKEDPVLDHQQNEWSALELKSETEEDHVYYDKLDSDHSSDKEEIARREKERLAIQENLNQQLADVPLVRDDLEKRTIRFDDIINKKEAAEMINQPGEEEMIIASQAGFIGDMKNQFLTAKKIEAEIFSNRRLLAQQIKLAKEKLDQIHYNHDMLVKRLSKFNAGYIEQQITPKQTKYDFIRQERNRVTNANFARLNEIVKDKQPFKPNSKNALDYENELYMISKMGLFKSKKQRDELLNQYEYVFNCLKINNIQLTPKIRAHIFEYLVVRNDYGLANNQLKNLTGDFTETQSPIDLRYLKLYLKNCLKNDQIDGVAYLVNYCQRYNVDCSEMPIEKFHSMLDYYLNHNFNLSKVMIFCKFYIKFYNDKISKELDAIMNQEPKTQQLTDEKKIILKDKVFGQHENLIDMRALSKFLVLQTADKQILDPLTREDSLWGLIDLFTQSADLFEASSLSKNNHIEPATIAEYFGKRLNQTDSLEKFLKVTVRLNQTKVGRDFSIKMLEQLKSFQSQRNGALPQSFTESAIKELYFKIRATDIQLDTQASELVLYILQQKGLHAEVIEFCERNPKKELTSYYLTESLLQLPLVSGTYAEALDKSGILKDDQNQSDLQAFKLTQQTKAVFLDKGPEAAYSFFEEQFTKMEESARQKKAFLVSLYDQMMPAQQEGVSFDVFKERYLKSSQLAVRFAKEAFVVNQIEEMLKNKNYDEIENLLNLYAVMREERLLLNFEYMIDDQDTQQIMHKSNIEKDQKNSARLKEVRKRKEKLQQLVGPQSVISLSSIARVMKDQEITVFQNANANQMQSVAAIFQDITQDEAESIEQRNKQLWSDEGEELTFSTDEIKKKLKAMGNNQELVDKFFIRAQSNIDSSQIEEQNQHSSQALLNSDGQKSEIQQKEEKSLLKIKADYDAILKHLNKPANYLKLAQKFQNDPQHKEKFQNFMFASESEYSELSEPDIKSHENFVRSLKKEYGSDVEYLLDNQPHHASSDQRSQVKHSVESNSRVNKNDGKDFLQNKQQEKSREFNHRIQEENQKNSEQTSSDEETKEKQKARKLYKEFKNQQEQIELKLAKREKMIQQTINQDGEMEFSSTQTEDEMMRNSDEAEELQDDINELRLGRRDAYAVPLSDLSEKEEQTEASKVMQELWDTIDANYKFYLEQNKNQYLQPQHEEVYLTEGMDKYYNIMQRKERDEFDYSPIKDQNDIQEKMTFDSYRAYLLDDPFKPSEVSKEPQALRETVHDASVFHLKEKLIDALNKRKYEALPIMVKMFNSIQRRKLGKGYSLEDFESKNVKDFTVLNQNDETFNKNLEEIKVDDIGQTVQKLDLLLNDSRSPILSALMETSKYKINKLPKDAHDYYPDAQSYVREPLDIGAYERDLNKLKILKFEIDRILKTAEQVDKKIIYSTNNVEGEINAKQQLNWKQRQQEIKQNQMGRLRLLHNEFNESFTNENLSQNDTKVRIMRDILTLELGQSFNVNAEEGKTANQFPVFYALDFINFGIKRNQPAAIRLGEKLLSDSCASEHAKLPKDLAESVKNYMLDYDQNLKYREAIKITGPINSSSIYHMDNQKSGKTSSFCLDDPYWQNFMLKNRRREDQWRNPSILAYKYKQFGILGEIFNMQDIQKRYEQEFSQFN